MTGRMTVALAAVAALVLTGCATSHSDSANVTHCGHSSNGVVCVVVMRVGTRVGDVIGYYSPARSLAGQTWRLDLVRYNCDPDASTACRPATQYPATERHRPPPTNGTCLAALYDTGQRQCTTRLAEALGSFGDWTGLPPLPSAALATHTWLCVTAQLAQHGSWQNQFSPATACYH